MFYFYRCTTTIGFAFTVDQYEDTGLVVVVVLYFCIVRQEAIIFDFIKMHSVKKSGQRLSGERLQKDHHSSDRRN